MMELSMLSHVNGNVLWVLGLIFGVLAIATLTHRILTWQSPDKDYTELGQRIHSWWWIVAAFAAAIVLSSTMLVVFFTLISFLALKEFLSLIPTRRADRRVLFWAYLTIPIQYYWVGIAWYGMFIVFIPVYGFLLLPMRMVLIGETKDFIRAAATLHWGLMTTVFSLSHVAFLMALPESVNPAGGGAGLMLFLVFLTQFNDVAQYVWGKLLGKRLGNHKVIPKISPNKTWAGLLGGLATTIVLASLLAPLLTPLNAREAVLAGVLIGLGGFIGDVTVSAVKRDLGVKDSGTLIPGHGGILDRVDSLTYTAPLFFHFIYYLHY